MMRYFQRRLEVNVCVCGNHSVINDWELPAGSFSDSFDSLHKKQDHYVDEIRRSGRITKASSLVSSATVRG